MYLRWRCHVGDSEKPSLVDGANETSLALPYVYYVRDTYYRERYCATAVAESSEYHVLTQAMTTGQINGHGELTFSTLTACRMCSGKSWSTTAVSLFKLKRA